MRKPCQHTIKVVGFLTLKKKKWLQIRIDYRVLQMQCACRITGIVKGEPRTSALVDRRPSPASYTMYLPFRFFESWIQFMNYWIAAVWVCYFVSHPPPPPHRRCWFARNKRLLSWWKNISFRYVPFLLWTAQHRKIFFWIIPYWAKYNTTRTTSDQIHKHGWILTYNLIALCSVQSCARRTPAFKSTICSRTSKKWGLAMEERNNHLLRKCNQQRQKRLDLWYRNSQRIFWYVNGRRHQS